MSSTGKTPKLGLCQWELSDQFRMEDMNEDFRKIDEALRDLPRQKLFDMTFDGDVSMVQLNCSETDMEQFAELEIFCDFVSSKKCMRMNEVTASHYFNGTSSGGRYSSVMELDTGKNRLLILGNKLLHRHEDVEREDSISRVYVPTLNSIEFFGSTDNPIVDGDRISVWGVKR